ncbi:hypothetical protein EJB05_24183, partial [Eragrostis curvula]
MEAPLLTRPPRRSSQEESSVWSEVKKQQRLDGPLVAGHLLVNVVDIIAIMFVGHMAHIGKRELAGASIAIATVTGFGQLV